MFWQRPHRFPSLFALLRQGKGMRYQCEPVYQPLLPLSSIGAAENLWAEDFSFPRQTELSHAGRSQAVGQSRYGTTFRALAGAQVCCWLWFCLLNYWTRPACTTGGCANRGLCDHFKQRILVWDERANPGNSPPAQQRGRGWRPTHRGSSLMQGNNCKSLSFGQKEGFTPYAQALYFGVGQFVCRSHNFLLFPGYPERPLGHSQLQGCMFLS